MSKFAALEINTSDAFEMPIVDTLTGAVLTDKDGKQAHLLLLSVDSDAGEKVERQQNVRRVRKARSGRNLMDEADDLTEAQLEYLVDLTVGWYLVDPDGNPLGVEFSKANAKELYTERGMFWLRRQAWAFVNTAGNFIKRSSNNSANSPSTNSKAADASPTEQASASI